MGQNGVGNIEKEATNVEGSVLTILSEQPSSGESLGNNGTIKGSEKFADSDTLYVLAENGNGYGNQVEEPDCENECISDMKCEPSDICDSKSILTSVMTADGISDVTGFFIVSFVTFLGNMSSGIFFPTMWPLVESLGGSTVTFGYTVSAYFFGRILVTPLFGSMSVNYGYAKTLLLSNFLTLIGGLVYAQCQNVGMPEFVILSRTILGIGSGTLGVTRAFASEVTAQRNRTQYMGWLVAVQYAGLTMTPFLGSVFFNWFGGEEGLDANQGKLFVLNGYTSPAYFVSIVAAITLVVIFIHFGDRKGSCVNKKQGRISKKRAAINELATSKTCIGLTTRDACILGCMLVNIAVKGAVATFETLGIKYAKSHFGLHSSRAGSIVSLCGLIGSVILIFIGEIERKVGNINLLWSSMLMMASGLGSIVLLTEENENPQWRFVVGCIMVYSIGYPLGQTATLGLFSKSEY
mmetsp:Transcript_31473/g.46069  ORF Transcript_31473/g.46069 Transcript_31473/m.46069 type:complete len:465 (+) Transcript_31473:79-1473(+)